MAALTAAAARTVTTCASPSAPRVLSFNQSSHCPCAPTVACAKASSSARSILRGTQSARLAPGASSRSIRARGRAFLCRAASDADVSASPATDDVPVSLGTAELPANCDLKMLETLMFQWASSLTANANLPLNSPLKVDKIPGGVQLGIVALSDEGNVTLPVNIMVTVEPPSAAGPAMFRCVRAGPYKQLTPPGEPAIMASLLVALRTSVGMACAPKS